MERYAVLAIVLIIFFGLWLYLWNLDRQVARLKKEIEEEHHESE